MLSLNQYYQKSKSVLGKLKAKSQRLRRGNKTAAIYPLDKFAFHQLSFAQEGEDLILARLFQNQSQGFYVDVGAHHPQRFSNTYYFYLRGWHGINIDATPDSMKAFQTIRSRDINLEIAVSDVSQTLEFYAFNEPALNTFSSELLQTYIDAGYHLLFKKEIETQPLSNILDSVLPPGQTIDFLTIDVEGLDYQVLKSNDWNRYRPTLVLVEALDLTTIAQAINYDSTVFMAQNGYQLCAKTVNTLFFRNTAT